MEGKERAEENLAGPADDTGFSIYTNAEYGIKLKYPSKWPKSEGHMGTVVSFVCPDDPMHISSLNLLVQDLNGSMTLEEFTQLSLEQMKAMMQGGWGAPKVWNADLFRLPGKRMQFVTPMGPFTVKVFQAWTVKNDLAYIFTFSAPADLHDTYREVVEKILDSMEFVAATPPHEKPIEIFCLGNYENQTHMFRLGCPLSWTLTQPKAGPAVTMEYKGPLSPKESSPVILRADVMVTPLPDPSWNLDQYSNIYAMRLADLLPTGEELPQKQKATLGGQEAYLVSYNSDAVTAGGRFTQIYTIKDGKVYILTTMTDAPKHDNRPLPLFKRVQQSFEFLSSGFQSKSHLVTYENLLYKVAFEFAKDEYNISNGFMGTLVSFERGGGSDVPFRSNVNLVVTEVPEGSPKTLDAFADVIRSQLEMAVEDSNIIAEEEITMSNTAARKITYCGKIAERRFKFEQRYLIHNNLAFVVSFSALEEDFASELQASQDLLNSFALLD
ncbi:hypothetical protein QOT17_002010 [Balamuthia mandrillaris]